MTWRTTGVVQLSMDEGLLKHVDFLVASGLYGIDREQVITHLTAAGIQRAVEIGIVEIEHVSLGPPGDYAYTDRNCPNASHHGHDGGVCLLCGSSLKANEA